MPPIKKYTTSPGKPYPFGITPHTNGYNFSVVSKSATSVMLCFFDSNSKAPLAEIPLSPEFNKTGNVWHIVVENLPENILYSYRVQPSIDSSQDLLLDPYAKSLATSNVWGNNPQYIPYGEVMADLSFDWEDDAHPLLAFSDLIIYEMHVRAFTKDPSSQVQHPGSFLGIIEKIPHLLDLGINAVELMPIHEFNELELAKAPPPRNKLCNFWGYSTVNYFAPMRRYATSQEPGAAIKEFKMMVKELHRHGIEVILDVVYNHTSEGNEQGPVLSFKGFDNALYYMMDQNHYRNYTGCGNTFNTNQASVQELIIDSLRYWVTEMHVDGFRFDLASIFNRDTKGTPLNLAPIIRAITEDPILAETKLIAEPWDAAGLYQVGNFACHSPHWSEWNDKFRDGVRRFIKGVQGTNGDFARRLSGSQDLYYNRTPRCSINFITAHDGFTLADLVSYNTKHNLANGENNQDGSNHNESWNCGFEGPTDDEKVLQLRRRQMRNFHLALMVSKGVPMILMGDEYAHTKQGNNNTWCQDGPLNWFQWNELAANQGFYRFCKGLIHFRLRNSFLRSNRFYTDDDVDWHGVEPMKADWKGNVAMLAFTLKDPNKEMSLYVAFNACHNELKVKLPAPPPNKQWRWVVNTANASPNDFFEEGQRPLMADEYYVMPAYSSLMLEI